MYYLRFVFETQIVNILETLKISVSTDIREMCSTQLNP